MVICFAFSIAHQDNFYFLNQGECPYVDEVDDVEGFEEMREAMDLVGIMEDQQLMIFRILAGILHIGNIDIHPSGEEESEIDVRHIHFLLLVRNAIHLHVGMAKNCDYTPLSGVVIFCFGGNRVGD